jgi:hypothetical protein
VKITKTHKSDDEAKTMAGYVASFLAIEDALAFENAALAAPNVHLPPVARSVRDGGQHTTLYWRWLNSLAEVWS